MVSQDLGPFSEQSQLIAKRAYEFAAQYKESVIDVSHVFMALLDSPDETLSKIFDSLSLDIEQLKSQTLVVIRLQDRVLFWKGSKQKMFTTLLVKQSIDAAIAISKELNEPSVSPADIFWSVINSLADQQRIRNEFQYRMTQIFSSNNITPERALAALKEATTQS
jgi:ATP-dependent Clp protease ATP-binding subunit ClpA